MTNFKELKVKHQYGVLIHNELTTFINEGDLDAKIEGKKLAKELGYAVIPYSWNTVKVYPTKGTIKTFAKLI